MKQPFLFYLLFFFILLIGTTGGSGCANIVPPSGGPRDSLPPVLVNADPPDSTVNFRGNTIQLRFDEFIDLQDVGQNLLFTPLFAPGKVPKIDAHLRTLTLHLRDSLEPNTTYTFNFGNALKDINEGNVLRNFTYTFSTGPFLDSLSLTGKVVLAESGNIDSNLIVVLHKNLTDSAVRKERPRYVTRLDATGQFLFRNLPAGTFAIYAFSDQGGSRQYLSPTQTFAFTDKPVTVSDTTKPVTLYAYKEQAVPSINSSPSISKNNNADRRLRFTTNLAANQQNLLDSFKVNFDQPLRSLDTTKMTLSTDSVFTKALYRLALDSAKKQLTLYTVWKPGTKYNLVLDKDFAEDTLGRKLLKTDTLFFTTKKGTDYGALNIRIHNADTAQHPVLQFIQNEVVVFAAPLINGRVAQTLFLPGDYDLRILYDRNRNGKWDAGQFFGQRLQPEMVRPISRKITVKAASDNDFDLAL